MKKVLLLAPLVLLLSACGEEPKYICVESHNNIIMMPVVISTGKSTYTVMQAVPVFVCDKEEPNPKYTGK